MNLNKSRLTTIPTIKTSTKQEANATKLQSLLQSAEFSVGSDSNIVHFDDYFYDKSIEELINKIESKLCSNNPSGDKDIYLYFASNGGYTYTLQRLVDYLENCNGNVHIMMSWAASCGVFLPLMLMRTKKYALLQSSISVFPHNDFLFHLSDRGEWSTRAKKDDRNDRKESDIAERSSKSLDEMIYNLCKEAGMTKKHLKLISRGQDVSYTSEEFDEMLSNVQKIYAPKFAEEFYTETFEEGLNNGYFTLDFVKKYIAKLEEDGQDILSALKPSIEKDSKKDKKRKKVDKNDK